jgi:hypothetical protein
LPPDTDHTFTNLSPLPETICCPSGLKATEKAKFVCPASDATSFLADIDHTFTNLSPLPEKICCPSGLKATEQTVLVWSSQRRNSLHTFDTGIRHQFISISQHFFIDTNTNRR